MRTLGQRTAPGRRAFLFGAAAALGTLSAAPASALLRPSAPETVEPRSLLMINQRTDEVFNEFYFDGNDYLPESLARFAHFARDLSTGEVGTMDPRLLDLASDLQRLSGLREPLILTHGFRSSSRRVRGGAANSHHLHGKALDITHRSLGARALYQRAAALGRGGLGRYPTFVHIDTGETRRW